MSSMIPNPFPEQPGKAVFRRQNLQDAAHAIGITDALIHEVVHEFYAKVRQHPLLGPVFEEEIGDRWDAHLETMVRFWSSVALNSGRYSGKPVLVHKEIAGITPGQFSVWLGLFEQTLSALAPSSEAKAYLMQRAGRIARTLKAAIEARDGAAQ